MHEKSTIYKIINTFTSTTQVPVMYVEDLMQIPYMTSENYDYAAVHEYADFDEIVSFLVKLFSQTEDSLRKVNIFYTKKNLVYLIIPVLKDKVNKGGFIAGPMLPYIQDKKIIDDTLRGNTLPLHRKVKLESLLRTIPLVSEERLNHLGQLLFVLCRSEEKVWYSSIAEEHVSNELFHSPIHFKDDDSNFALENDEYNQFYGFCLKLKNKIIHGNTDGLIDLLNNHSNIFWNTLSIDDNFRPLKNKCIILCAVSCVFAIQGNAPYKRVIGLMANFASNITNMNTPQEIILKATYTLETFAYLVSISGSSTYSLHIKRVMQYIKLHYKEKITLKKLAEFVNLNAVYLSSLIKKETNLSLLDNINIIRIEEGKNLLIFTNKSIQEISFTLGYNYQNHFNNVFKKFTGMTPLEFRHNFGRNSINPDAENK